MVDTTPLSSEAGHTLPSTSINPDSIDLPLAIALPICLFFFLVFVAIVLICLIRWRKKHTSKKTFHVVEDGCHGYSSSAEYNNNEMARHRRMNGLEKSREPCNGNGTTHVISDGTAHVISDGMTHVISDGTTHVISDGMTHVISDEDSKQNGSAKRMTTTDDDHDDRSDLSSPDASRKTLNNFANEHDLTMKKSAASYSLSQDALTRDKEPASERDCAELDILKQSREPALEHINSGLDASITTSTSPPDDDLRTDDGDLDTNISNYSEAGFSREENGKKPEREENLNYGATEVSEDDDNKDHHWTSSYALSGEDNSNDPPPTPTPSHNATATDDEFEDCDNPTITSEYHALYDFVANEDGELTFHVGDTIVVTETLDNGWWRGCRGDADGWFPGSYVKPVVEHLNPHVVAQGPEVGSNFNRTVSMTSRENDATVHDDLKEIPASLRTAFRYSEQHPTNINGDLTLHMDSSLTEEGPAMAQPIVKSSKWSFAKKFGFSKLVRFMKKTRRSDDDNENVAAAVPYVDSVGVAKETRSPSQHDSQTMQNLSKMIVKRPKQPPPPLPPNSKTQTRNGVSGDDGKHPDTALERSKKVSDSANVSSVTNRSGSDAETSFVSAPEGFDGESNILNGSNNGKKRTSDENKSNVAKMTIRCDGIETGADTTHRYGIEDENRRSAIVSSLECLPYAPDGFNDDDRQIGVALRVPDKIEDNATSEDLSDEFLSYLIKRVVTVEKSLANEKKTRPNIVFADRSEEAATAPSAIHRLQVKRALPVGDRLLPPKPQWIKEKQKARMKGGQATLMTTSDDLNSDDLLFVASRTTSRPVHTDNNGDALNEEDDENVESVSNNRPKDAKTMTLRIAGSPPSPIRSPTKAAFDGVNNFDRRTTQYFNPKYVQRYNGSVDGSSNEMNDRSSSGSDLPTPEATDFSTSSVLAMWKPWQSTQLDGVPRASSPTDDDDVQSFNFIDSSRKNNGLTLKGLIFKLEGDDVVFDESEVGQESII